MNKVLAILMALMLVGCTSNNRRPGNWLWSETTPKADSISREIDRQHTLSVSRDSLIRSIEMLRLQADSRKDPKMRKLLRARYNYMLARQARTDGNPAEARRLLTEAQRDIDSATYPYEFHRMRTLANSLKPENSKDVFVETLRDLAFYRSIGDMAMEASTSILVGHKLADSNVPEKALSYYRQADSIYAIVGMQNLQHKNAINISNQLNNMGLTAEGDSILKVLRDDPHIKSDLRAYNLVLRNSYLRSGDIRYLHEAYASLGNSKKTEGLKALYMLMLGRHYAEKEMIPDSADAYSQKAFAHIGVVSDHFQRALIYLGESDRMSRLGMADSAFRLQSLYIQEIDSFRKINQPTEVMRVQNVMELNRLEEEITRASYSYQMRILYICIVALIITALLAGILFVRERIHKDAVRRNMTQKMEAQQEMERSRRQMLALSLAREESEKTLAAVQEEISSLRRQGKVSQEEASCIDAAIRNHSMQRGEWEIFQEQLEKTSPYFIKELRRRAPGITESQIRLAAYIHIGMTNKQISSFMNIRPDSIKQARWRLRSRLGLASDDSLEEYLASMRMPEPTT